MMGSTKKRRIRKKVKENKKIFKDNKDNNISNCSDTQCN